MRWQQFCATLTMPQPISHVSRALRWISKHTMRDHSHLFTVTSNYIAVSVPEKREEWERWSAGEIYGTSWWTKPATFVFYHFFCRILWPCYHDQQDFVTLLSRPAGFCDLVYKTSRILWPCLQDQQDSVTLLSRPAGHCDLVIKTSRTLRLCYHNQTHTILCLWHNAMQCSEWGWWSPEPLNV